MSSKRNNYVSMELDFAERQLETWKVYIENNSIETLEDRWGRKEMPKGGYTMVVTATRESQIKCVQDTLAKYLMLLEQVNNMREAEEKKKIDNRGGQELSPNETGDI